MSEKAIMKYRMGGFLAVMAMLGFLAAMVGIVFLVIPDQNRDFFNMALVALIGFVGTAIGYYLGSSQGSARKTELSAAPAPSDEISLLDDQSGFAHLESVMTMAFVALAAVFMLAGIALQGCAPHQSATQQIVSQTDDPAAIALGTFADAQDAYIEALELYRPYKTLLQQTDPTLDAEIVRWFRKANTILVDWETFGDVPDGDKASFRGYLREISLKLAVALDKKTGGDQ